MPNVERLQVPLFNPIKMIIRESGTDVIGYSEAVETGEIVNLEHSLHHKGAGIVEPIDYPQDEFGSFEYDTRDYYDDSIIFMSSWLKRGDPSIPTVPLAPSWREEEKMPQVNYEPIPDWLEGLPQLRG